MHQPYTTAAPKQLHATIPGPNGTHACLTLYNVCPHTCHPTASLQSRDPYLHCDLPSLLSAPGSRTLEYINRDGKRIVETTRSTLSPLPSPRSTQAIDCIEYMDRKARDGHDTTRSTLSSTATPLRSILKPSSVLSPLPTIYLLTFSTDRTPTTQAFARLLNEHLPPRVPLRYTIDARQFLVPSWAIQEAYSGVAEIAQDAVLRDAGARREIDHAVDVLVAFVRSGGRETSIAVCCTAGTHRSVAIAECIAKGVRREVRRVGSREGVKVVVRHVHRVKGVKDPY